MGRILPKSTQIANTCTFDLNRSPPAPRSITRTRRIRRRNHDLSDNRVRLYRAGDYSKARNFQFNAAEGSHPVAEKSRLSLRTLQISLQECKVVDRSGLLFEDVRSTESVEGARSCFWTGHGSNECKVRLMIQWLHNPNRWSTESDSASADKRAQLIKFKDQYKTNTFSTPSSATLVARIPLPGTNLRLQPGRSPKSNVNTYITHSSKSALRSEKQHRLLSLMPFILWVGWCWLVLDFG
jgi:hypothetical protein